MRLPEQKGNNGLGIAGAIIDDRNPIQRNRPIWNSSGVSIVGSRISDRGW